MTTAAQTPPPGYSTVSPYLNVVGADRLIDFMQQVFDAQEQERILRSDGVIMHAEVRIGDSVVMLGEVGEGMPATPAMLHVYVPDADAAYQRALAAGATSVQAPADQPHGDRLGGARDDFGNFWWFATHLEDVPREEIQRRMDAARKA
jgi:PhnB protein